MRRSRQPITAGLSYHGISLANVVTYIKCELTSTSRKLFKMPKIPHITRCKCNNCHLNFQSCTCRFYMCNHGDSCTECPSIVPVPSDSDDSNLSGILSSSLFDFCISETDVPPDASLLKTPATSDGEEQGELFNEK